MRLLAKIFFSIPSLGLLLTLTVLLTALLGSSPLQSLDHQIFDQLIKFRKPADADAVVMVAIDLKSRQQLGDTPWSRRQLTELIKSVEAQNPAAIGLSFPLSLPSNDPAADRALADRAANLAVRLEARQAHHARLPGDAHFFADRSVPRIIQIESARELLLSLRNPLLAYLPQTAGPAFSPPFAELQDRVQAGHLILDSDGDNQLRRLPLLSPWQDRLLPSLPLQLLLKASGEQLQDIGYGSVDFPASLRVGTQNLSLGRNFQLLLDRSGRNSNLQSISASDLLQQKIPPSSLRNRIVLIGESPDTHRQQDLTPLAAAALATLSLVNGTPLHQPAWAWLLETLILLYFGAFCFLLLPRLSARSGFFALLLFLLTWLIVAAASLILSGAWFQVAPALALCLLGFLLVQFKLLRRNLSTSAAESNKMLGLTLQEQGLLDLALERFLRCPPDYSGMKELLYNLGLDFERKRMPQKALAVYRHLQKAGRFRDLKQRISQLKEMERTIIIGPANGTMHINKSGEKPILGRYRVEKILGQGAMGTVYLGVDPKINRQVAIKTLAYAQIEPTELAEVKARFFREAEAAGRLSHPHIVTVYDVGEESDLAYMAMELLDGRDLSAYCDKKQRLKPLQIMQIGAQIAGALAYAHSRDVVHRDIKPANIMLGKDGQIKVADFGVARVMSSSRTETGVVLGTPSYMSPEQVAGKRVDGRSDLFSLGVVFYELLSGEKPFVADSLTALMYNIANVKYPDLQEVCPGLPADCYQIVERLLSKSVNRRYKSADLLQRDIFDLLERMEGR